MPPRTINETSVLRKQHRSRESTVQQGQSTYSARRAAGKLRSAVLRMARELDLDRLRLVGRPEFERAARAAGVDQNRGVRACIDSAFRPKSGGRA